MNSIFWFIIFRINNIYIFDSIAEFISKTGRMDGLDLKSYADAVKVFDEIGLIEEAEVLRGYERECREMLWEISY